jgi:hypothetical protein
VRRITVKKKVARRTYIPPTGRLATTTRSGTRFVFEGGAAAPGGAGKKTVKKTTKKRKATKKKVKKKRVVKIRTAGLPTRATAGMKRHIRARTRAEKQGGDGDMKRKSRAKATRHTRGQPGHKNTPSSKPLVKGKAAGQTQPRWKGQGVVEGPIEVKGRKQQVNLKRPGVDIAREVGTIVRTRSIKDPKAKKKLVI